MRQALSARPASTSPTEAPPPHWLELPLLCCQAAGGDPRLAEPAASAWALLYTAAHLLDNVQDGDPLDPWWEPHGAASAINAATGLIATSALQLARGHSPSLAASTKQRLLEDFFHTVLLMGSGQHQDLTAPTPTLEDCWRIAEAKSGAFFGLACRAGARAAGIDEALVSHYSSYGVCLGLLVQIGDDLGDAAAIAPNRDRQPEPRRMALPLAYLRSVVPPDDAGEMNSMQAAAGGTGQPARGTAGWLHASGAGLYLTAKAHELRQRGASALRPAAPPSPALDRLLELLDSTPAAI